MTDSLNCQHALFPHEHVSDRQAKYQTSSLNWIEGQLKNNPILNLPIHRHDKETNYRTEFSTLKAQFTNIKTETAYRQTGMYLWKFLYDLSSRFINYNQPVHRCYTTGWGRMGGNISDVKEVRNEISIIKQEIIANEAMTPDEKACLCDVIALTETHLDKIKEPPVAANQWFFR